MAVLPENMAVEMGATNTATKHSMHEMKMSDIKQMFKEDFPDEMHDSNKYCDMAKVAEMDGHMELAKGLHAMSYDEYTHAKFIHDHLIDWGCEIPEKEMMEWQELCERIRRHFRR